MSRDAMHTDTAVAYFAVGFCIGLTMGSEATRSLPQWEDGTIFWMIPRLLDARQVTLSSAVFYEPEQVGDSVSQGLSITREAGSMEEIANAVKGSIGAVEGVEQIYLLREGDRLVHVWTVVEEAGDELRGVLYSTEYDLLSRSAGSDFDFHLLERRGRSIADLSPYGATPLLHQE